MNIRNVAIIAHVDHGKTTLVDALLTQSHAKIKKERSEAGLIMDNNELERERGITIFSKIASVYYKGVKINIIDTPGHADFGGEVERVLGMADGCLLLVDAKEGPMPQTRFVLKQALKMRLKIIVVINKIDKIDARCAWAVDRTFDLMVDLGADEENAFFPVVYASGRLGKSGETPDLSKMVNIEPIFEAILKYIPEPRGDAEMPFQMLVSSISYDNYKGRIATGKIANGRISQGMDVAHIDRKGEIKNYRLTSLMTYEGLERIDEETATAGDIVSIAGISEITIGETVADPVKPQALPVINVEEPTVIMNFMVNDSPFAGREGKFKTSREVGARLFKELETDVALRVEPASAEAGAGKWKVSGRGELHLAILIERMRREGYELQVSRPQAIIKEVNGVKQTPYERVFIEVPDEFSGIVVRKMGERHAKMEDMNSRDGLTEMQFTIATYNFFGFRSEFMTDTKGLGVVNSVFEEFRRDEGIRRERNHGSLVAYESGQTRLYGLVNVQDRGILFVGPAVDVYKGQVVGQNSRSGDILVNVCKEKKLSNMRSKGDGKSEHLNAPKIMSLEDAIEYIDDSELVEVTPKNIRIRKIILDAVEEKRLKKLGLRV
jgi:GTP-binding protein